MLARFLLVIALLLGIAAGLAADAFGFSRTLVQFATFTGFALLVAGPLWWMAHCRDQQGG